MNKRDIEWLDKLWADQATLHAAAARMQAERGRWAGLAADDYGLAAIELLSLLATTSARSAGSSATRPYGSPGGSPAPRLTTRPPAEPDAADTAQRAPGH
jgi:hypothetical protein